MPSKSTLSTLAASLISAYACWLVVHHATPIDRSLPFIAFIIGVVAAVSTTAILSSVLLLMAAEIAIADERLRLLAFGVIVGVAFAAAFLARRSEWSFARAATLTVSAILLLRWIPLENVLFGREIALLVIAVGILAVLRSTPLAVAVAVAATLFTPAIPLRTLALPLAVLIVGALLRVPQWGAASAAPGRRGRRLPTENLAAFACCVMLIFFPWSGVFARALPVMLRGVRVTERQPISIALAADQSTDLDVPEGATALILSGANVPRLTKGTVLGRIDPGAIHVRIGDLADWGVLRREHFYASLNPLPRDSAGLLRDYGQAAWIDGAGRVRLPKSRTIRITADSRLAPDARLQIDAFEMGNR